MLSSGARLAVCRWNKRRSIFSAIPCRTTCPTGAAGVTVGMARTGCSVKPMTPSRRWVRLSYRRNSSKTRRSLQSSSVLAARSCKILHDLAAKTELDCKLLRVFDEFLRYDKRTQRREGVMGFSEQPVRAMPTVASAAAVGHVVLQGIAENMLRRSFHRHTTSRTSDDNIQLTFPIDTLAAIGNSNRFAVSDHCRNRLRE